MKENVLREMIRKQIKSSLNEAPGTASSRVGASLGRVEKMAGVKMLKKALGQGSPQQQAAGLLQVVQAISGNNPSVGRMLARMLMKQGVEAPVEEGAPAAVGTDQNDDLNTAEPDNGHSLEENQALKRRQDRVDKTQAMKMLKQTLSTKAATQQTDFVLDLINGLDLKKAAKQRLFLKIRKGLE